MANCAAGRLALTTLMAIAVSCAACQRGEPPPETGTAAIINGQEDTDRHYPEVERVSRNGGFICSGTLIGARTVLTAAHCIDSGSYTYGPGWREVVRTIVHPHHPQREGRFSINDLAILHLDGSPGLRPRSLSWQLPAKQTMTAVGLGATSDAPDATGHGVRRYYSDLYGLVGSFLKLTDADHSTAGGDSGGGLFLGGADRWASQPLVGVNIGSHDGTIITRADAFAVPVANFRQWITDQTAAHNDVLRIPVPGASRLESVEGLYVEDHLSSPNGVSQLRMQRDGNLVLYRSGAHAWSTATQGRLAGSASMQADGNFVVHDRDGAALWAAGTQNHPGSYLRLQNDGNLVVYQPAGRALWASNTVMPPPAACRIMETNRALSLDQSLSSCSGRSRLIMQRDGNLVLYRDGAPVWSTRTAGSDGYVATMQPDGNLVVYGRRDNALWASNTDGRGSRLQLQNDGNLVVYASNGGAVWASNTDLTRPSGCRNLDANRILRRGQHLASCNRRFELRMQLDGNLVLYDGNRPIWHTNTAGRDGDLAVLQGDGNFVLYDSQDRALWNTGTTQIPGARLDVQDDGNLVLYDVENVAHWASGTVVRDPPGPTGCRNLNPGHALARGVSLSSCNGRLKLTMQHDGNLVLYADGTRPIWHTNTFNRDGHRALMQPDGNFVLYDSAGRAIWHSNTAGLPGCRLDLQDDGNLVVYDIENVPHWASNTMICPGPVCGGRCCPAQAWCGAPDRCCVRCGPGCPC